MLSCVGLTGEYANGSTCPNNIVDKCCPGVFPAIFSALDLEPALPCEPGSTAMTHAALNSSSYSASTLSWTNLMDPACGNAQTCPGGQHTFSCGEGVGCSSMMPHSKQYFLANQYNAPSPLSSDGGGDTPADSPALCYGGGSGSSLPAALGASLSSNPAVMTSSAAAVTTPAAKAPFTLLSGMSPLPSMPQLLTPQQQPQQQQSVLQLQSQPHPQAAAMRGASCDSITPGLSLKLRRTHSGSTGGGSADGATPPVSATTPLVWSQPQPGGTSGGMSCLAGLKRMFEDDGAVQQMSYSPTLGQAGGSSSSNTKNRDAQRRFRQRQRDAFAAMEARVRAQEQQLQSLYREKRMVEQHNEVLLRQLRAYELSAEQQQQRKEQMRGQADDPEEDNYRPHLCCLCGSAIFQQQQQQQQQLQQQQPELQQEMLQLDQHDQQHDQQQQQMLQQRQLMSM